MAEPLPDLTRPGAGDFFRGFGLALRGFGLLFATPRLKWLTLSVAAITSVTLVALLIGLLRFAPWLVQTLWERPQAWYLAALHTSVTAVAFVVLFVAGAVLLPPLVAVPFIDPLSIHTERALGFAVSDEGGMWRLLREVARALSNALMRGLILLLGHLLLLLLFLLPGVGQVLYSVLGWMWTSVWAAAQYLDVPMARHLYGWEEEVALVRRRFALCLGFGGAVAILLWVPILNAFLVPVAVIGATALFRSLVRSGALPPPKGERNPSQAQPR